LDLLNWGRNFYIMSVEEMKKVITEKVSRLNEDQLQELNNFLNRINDTPANEWDLIEHVNNIVNEREEVLKKLAK